MTREFCLAKDLQIGDEFEYDNKAFGATLGVRRVFARDDQNAVYYEQYSESGEFYGKHWCPGCINVWVTKREQSV